METQTLVAAAAPQTYTCISQLRDGYASVKNHNGWGLIDSTGREIIPCCYPSVDYQGGGLIRICEKQEMFFKLDFDMLDVSCYRIVDMQGNTVISNDDGPIAYAHEIDAFIVCKQDNGCTVSIKGCKFVGILKRCLAYLCLRGFFRLCGCLRPCGQKSQGHDRQKGNQCQKQTQDPFFHFKIPF